MVLLKEVPVLKQVELQNLLHQELVQIRLPYY